MSINITIQKTRVARVKVIVTTLVKAITIDTNG